MFRHHVQRQPVRGGQNGTGNSHQLQRPSSSNGGDVSNGGSGLDNVCSEFYTNNPLLYVSRYSDIGFDNSNSLETLNLHLQSPADTVKLPPRRDSIRSRWPRDQTTSGANTVTSSLSSRRQAVELLHLDRPLIDYLTFHGVLSRHDADTLVTSAEDPHRSNTNWNDSDSVTGGGVTSEAKRNLVVLRCVDAASSRGGLELLLNALRFTGQFFLANLLDCSDRVRTRSQQQYFGSERYKGQLTVKVRMAAVRLSTVLELGALSTVSEWVTLDQLTSQLHAVETSKPINSNRSQQQRHSAMAPPQLVHSPGIPTLTFGGRSKQPEAAGNTVDIAQRKQQLIGKLVSWMTSGWNRGGSGDRFSRNFVTDASAALQVSKLSRQSLTLDKTQSSSKWTSTRLQSKSVDGSRTDAVSSSYKRTNSADVSTSGSASVELSSGVSGSKGDQSQYGDTLRRAIESVRVASQEFYSSLIGNTTVAETSMSRDRLVRFFEVERRALVLDTLAVNKQQLRPSSGSSSDGGGARSAAVAAANVEAVSIVIICPTFKHLDQIRRHFYSGQLREDLEKCLLTSDFMDELTAALVDAVRLDVHLDQEDVEAAQYELSRFPAITSFNAELKRVQDCSVAVAAWCG